MDVKLAFGFAAEKFWHCLAFIGNLLLLIWRVLRYIWRISVPKGNRGKQKRKTNGKSEPGGKRHFGEYSCYNCGNTWESGYSWTNKTQACFKCKLDVLPRKQRPLQKGSSFGLFSTTHSEKDCQKCQELGYCCRPEGPVTRYNPRCPSCLIS